MSKTSSVWDPISTESLAVYLRQIHDIPLLAPAEETALGHAIQAGDQDAAQHLTVHNLRYAAHCARKWEHTELRRHEKVWDLGDAIQAANLGLWQAALRFDPTRARFTTYATWWIRQAWQRARGEFIWVMRLPAHAEREWYAYQQAVQQTPDAPVDDLAATLHWLPERVVFWQTWEKEQARPVSLDYPSGSPDEETALADYLATPDTPEDMVISSVQHQYVAQLLERLTSREADVLRQRFGLEDNRRSLQDIGQHYGISRERVRQIEADALNKLRHHVQTDAQWTHAELFG